MSINYYDFDPFIIKWQWRALSEVYNADYSLGVHEFAFCGIVGSAKTTMACWLAIDHCCKYKGARFLVGRKSFSDLISSCHYELSQMIYATWGELSRGWITTKGIKFPWGSEIVFRTWGDGKYESKFKSLNLSGAWLEEPTENSPQEYDGLMSLLRARLSRVNHKNSDVKENFLLLTFNAYDPDHPLYREFYEQSGERIHLIESKQRDNPFLHEQYYENLMQSLSRVEARRQVLGEWVSHKGEVIYYEYDKSIHFTEEKYTIKKDLDLLISFDFNIADGKPMSALVAQEIDGHYHVFDEIVIHGGRTQDVCDEISNRGYDKYSLSIYGDATGKARSTKTINSDYDIIKNHFRRVGASVRYFVPLSNPPVRERHNIVNGVLMNANGLRRLTVYNCITLNRGLMLTKFKKGTSIEDDSNDYQHITTALGYMIVEREKARSFIKVNRFSSRR